MRNEEEYEFFRRYFPRVNLCPECGAPDCGGRCPVPDDLPEWAEPQRDEQPEEIAPRRRAVNKRW